MTQEEKIINRVRKMLAIANDDAASEGERDNALRMSHALLAKHNLSMKQVETITDEEERGACILETKAVYPWKRYVSFAIAKLFFCRYYFTQTTKVCKHNFIGLESNSTTAMEIAHYAIRSIEREAARYVKDGGAGTPRDFAKGAAHRIHVRCDKLRKEAEDASRQEAAPGTTLVLASVYQMEDRANDEWLANVGIELRDSKNRQRDANGEAWSAGHAYGDKISLNRQLNEQQAAGHLN